MSTEDRFSLDPEEQFNFGTGPLPRRDLPYRLVGCPICGERHFNNEACALDIVPVTLAQAKGFVLEHHRHSKPPVSHRFSLGVSARGTLVGVAIVGRPLSRHLDDGLTCEVLRVCSRGGRNVASKLIGAAWRAARALGYRRAVTYTLASESGASLRASGWRQDGWTRGGSWATAGRSSQDVHRERRRRWFVHDGVAGIGEVEP